MKKYQIHILKDQLKLLDKIEGNVDSFLIELLTLGLGPMLLINQLGSKQ